MATKKTVLLTLSLVSVGALGACAGPGGFVRQGGPQMQYLDPQATALWCPGVGTGVANGACGKYQLMNQLQASPSVAYPVPYGTPVAQPMMVPSPQYAQPGVRMVAPQQQPNVVYVNPQDGYSWGDVAEGVTVVGITAGLYCLLSPDC